MSLVFGAILPHGPDVVPELAQDPAVMAETRAAMEEAGRRFTAAQPDTLILLDPHAPTPAPADHRHRAGSGGSTPDAPAVRRSPSGGRPKVKEACRAHRVSRS